MEDMEMIRKIMPRAAMYMILCCTLPAISAFAQSVAPFDASPLVKLGDSVKYGSYIIYKIGEGIYKINDPGKPPAIMGGAGVDMYMICGEKKALMIDLGNNYTVGYEKDLIAPRKNAAEELRNVAYGLAGRLQLEIAFTHTGPDHQGMTKAFIDRNVPMWLAEGEDANRPKQYFKSDPIDPSVYSRFKHGEKSFDLGGGRIVETFMVRGHTDAGTVFILKKEGILVTGDAVGFGNGLGLTTVDKINGFRVDIQKLVDYIFANFSPYERYALRVYTGHSHLDTRGASPNQDAVDSGYMDWRYIQNMASCANAVAKGMWLVEGSPLRYVRRQPNSNPSPAVDEGAIMVYGIGSLKIPIGLAYEVAGLKMPQ